MHLVKIETEYIILYSEKYGEKKIKHEFVLEDEDRLSLEKKIKIKIQ